MPKLTNENLKEFLQRIWIIYMKVRIGELDEDGAIEKAKELLKEWGIEI